MPIVLTTFEEFAAQQGCEYLSTTRNSSDPYSRQVLFANGAMSDMHHSHKDPPTDPDKLIRLRLKFVRLKLKRVRLSYKQAHAGVNTQIMYLRLNAGNHPDVVMPGWEEHLQRLLREVEALQAEKQTLVAELPEAQLQRQIDEEANARRQDVSNALYKLNQFSTLQ